MIYNIIDAFLFHVDDHCQFWIDETAGVLTSPYFAGGPYGYGFFDGVNQLYGHNLNCIWTLNAKEGFYINLEIDYFKVYIIMTNT